MKRIFTSRQVCQSSLGFRQFTSTCERYSGSRTDGAGRHTLYKSLIPDKPTSSVRSKHTTYKEMWALLSELSASNGQNTTVSARRYPNADIDGESKPQTTLYPSKIEILKELTESDQKLGPPTFAGVSAVQSPAKMEAEEAFNSSNTLMAFLDDPLKSSNVLYWACGTLSLTKSDFQKLMPSLSSQTLEERLLLGEELSGDHAEVPEFEVIRSRHPKTLTRWIGYFLIFTSRNAAIKFQQETLGSELCGMQVNFSFVDPSKPNIHPYLLYEVPGVTRSMCALVSGLPPKMSRISIARALFEYDLIEDESKAIIKLTGDGHTSQSSWLIRFKNEDEPKRLRKRFHRREWPMTTMTPSVEILD